MKPYLNTSPWAGLNDPGSLLDVIIQAEKFPGWTLSYVCSLLQ